jgi:hypothetical protein
VSEIPDKIGLMTSAGAAVAMLACVSALLLPRRYLLVPLLAVMSFVPLGLRVIILGLDFPIIRILLAVSCTRLALANDFRLGRLRTIDKAILAYMALNVCCYTILWGTVGALVNRLGLAYTSLGSYFLCRTVLREKQDCVRTAILLAAMAVPLGLFMLYEAYAGSNPFALLGGVPWVSAVREGWVRCQGPFGHPILAGTFGATTLPVIVGLAREEKRNWRLISLSLASCVAIVVTASSSGPVGALLAGLMGLALWPIRRHMRLVRWGTAVGLFALASVMKAPIWFLLARVKVFAGSTAYFRAYLIDRAIANLPNWWLVGTQSTRAWADWTLGLHDRTNEYVVVGAEGGLLTLAAFIAVIAVAFATVGRTRARVAANSRVEEFAVWSLGAALFAHVVNYLSVSYFDQNIVNWYLLLSLIAASEAWKAEKDGGASIVARRSSRRVSFATVPVGPSRTQATLSRPARSIASGRGGDFRDRGDS